jgi:tRNA dimethylallyltransferase
VPADSGFRVKLEKKSIEELTEILSTYKNLHNTTDIDTRKRIIRAIEIEHFNLNRGKQKSEFPKVRSLVAGLAFDRVSRRRRITERLKQRLDAGMVDEVKRLIDQGISTETLIYYGLEYKFITLFLTGKLSYDKMVTDLEIAIHQFAKRQMTWFRGMERKGIKIHWMDVELSMEEKVGRVLELLMMSPHLFR